MKAFQDNKLKCESKIEILFWKSRKELFENKKVLITSIFSFFLLSSQKSSFSDF